MSAWHAIHPSPYDDACPDCAGYEEPADPARKSRDLSRLVAVFSLLAAVALATLALLQSKGYHL